VYRKGEQQANDDEKRFSEQIRRMEEEKRLHTLKKMELDNKKKLISQDIIKLKELQTNQQTHHQNNNQNMKSNINQQNTKNNKWRVLEHNSPNENNENYRSTYNEETLKQLTQKYIKTTESGMSPKGGYTNMYSSNNSNNNVNVNNPNFNESKNKHTNANEDLILERANQIRNENKKYYNNIVGNKKESDPMEENLLSSYNNKSNYDISKSNILSSYNQNEPNEQDNNCNLKNLNININYYNYYFS